MPDKFLRLVLRSLFRSRTRLLATVGGCTIAAIIVCFFLAAGSSIERLTAQAEDDGSVLVVTQKDRY